MDDLLREFLTETSESLARMDIELVRLEQNPDDPALLGSIFRLVHTIKGTCGFLGLPRLEHVAHAAENILGKFRDGELKVTPEAVTLILRSIDAIKSLLSFLEETHKEADGNDGELIAALNAMANGAAAAPPPSVPPPVEFTPVERPSLPPAETATAAPIPAAHDNQQAGKQQETTPKDSSVANQSIRVDVKHLENLMNTVSELVLTRNQLLQILRTQKETAFTAPLQRLNQVTSELQEDVMKTRMQPIGSAWSKLPRIIRDLSHELGKKIDLVMVGEETELDRQVLELIKDPLTHMVRNSADHGIELPEERRAAGKKETGAITLNAYHEGGQIIIEIADDGRGLALSKIKAKALQNGLASGAELEAMSDQQIMRFIFEAGFSTAAKVTSVSGRGVGMDVVRTNIEKIGGTIDLQSKEGHGSSFRIKIPLTLAIVSALILECNGERFAIPQLNVQELVHASADSEHRIETINNARVLRLRDRLLPLISLESTLKLASDPQSVAGMASIIVVQAGGFSYGIMVDRVCDTEEIVVKPVSPLLHSITVFSGNTILGDGKVIMILDPNGLAAHAVDAAASHEQAHAASGHKAHKDDSQTYLLFMAGGSTPKAVPLSLVARLEDIPRATIEHSNEMALVQYRGELMPLISLDGNYGKGTEGHQPVVVFSGENRNVGLLVDSIVDIVAEHAAINGAGHRPGCFGSAILCGKATDMIDIAYYLEQIMNACLDHERRPGCSFESQSSKHILLVDDSPFFRNLLTPLLSVAGYAVTTAENPTQAMKIYESGAAFDAIVSDIEMPDMNGFEFVASLRREGRWSQLPIIALSSHASMRDFERGKHAGFTDYIAKFNREGLLDALHSAFDARGAIP